MSAHIVLERLEKVRHTGPGRWIARCPAHDDRSPSLSIREADGGRVLIHCFGGCKTGAILDAIGVEFSTLFEKREPGAHYRPIKASYPASDLLLLISHEAQVVAQIAALAQERPWLEDEEIDRLVTAAERIGRARDAIRG